MVASDGAAALPASRISITTRTRPSVRRSTGAAADPSASSPAWRQRCASSLAAALVVVGRHPPQVRHERPRQLLLALQAGETRPPHSNVAAKPASRGRAARPRRHVEAAVPGAGSEARRRCRCRQRRPGSAQLLPRHLVPAAAPRAARRAAGSAARGASRLRPRASPGSTGGPVRGSRPPGSRRPRPGARLHHDAVLEQPPLEREPREIHEIVGVAHPHAPLARSTASTLTGCWTFFASRISGCGVRSALTRPSLPLAPSLVFTQFQTAGLPAPGGAAPGPPSPR